MASLAGSFLIARKTLKDPFFGRAVVLMLQHGPDGAFGLVLNRVERVEKSSEFPFPIHIGGPCKFQGLIMLHGEEEWVPEEEREAAQICPGVYLGDAECLKRVTDSALEGPSRYRLFTGYAGWGPGQLESELGQGAWAIAAASASPVFELAVEELWLRLSPPSIPEPSLN